MIRRARGSGHLGGTSAGLGGKRSPLGLSPSFSAGVSARHARCPLCHAIVVNAASELRVLSHAASHAARLRLACACA